MGLLHLNLRHAGCSVTFFRIMRVTTRMHLSLYRFDASTALSKKNFTPDLASYNIHVSVCLGIHRGEIHSRLLGRRMILLVSGWMINCTSSFMLDNTMRLEVKRVVSHSGADLPVLSVFVSNRFYLFLNNYTRCSHDRTYITPR